MSKLKQTEVSVYTNMSPRKEQVFHIHCFSFISFFSTTSFNHLLVPPIALSHFCFCSFFCLQELQKEKNCTSVQLDQSTRRLSQLEEEKKASDQSFKRTQGLLDDLKGNWLKVYRKSAQVTYLVICLVFLLWFSFYLSAKSEGQVEELKRLQSKLEQQTQASSHELENLKKTLSDAETKNDRWKITLFYCKE